MSNLLTEEEIRALILKHRYAEDMLREAESAILAKQREQSEPVAYGVFWRIDGNEVLQFPVCANEDEAKADLRMYSAGDQAAMTIRPLYAAPQPAPEGMVWKPLTDVQWMNIVNLNHAWADHSTEDAVHEAVKLTEARLKMNNAPIAAAEQEDTCRQG